MMTVGICIHKCPLQLGTYIRCRWLDDWISCDNWASAELSLALSFLGASLRTSVHRHKDQLDAFADSTLGWCSWYLSHVLLMIKTYLSTYLNPFHGKKKSYWITITYHFYSYRVYLHNSKIGIGNLGIIWMTFDWTFILIHFQDALP